MASFGWFPSQMSVTAESVPVQNQGSGIPLMSLWGFPAVYVNRKLPAEMGLVPRQPDVSILCVGLTFCARMPNPPISLLMVSVTSCLLKAGSEKMHGFL